jgi:type II secretory pathway pseudopilin PulG
MSGLLIEVLALIVVVAIAAPLGRRALFRTTQATMLITITLSMVQFCEAMRSAQAAAEGFAEAMRQIGDAAGRARDTAGTPETSR